MQGAASRDAGSARSTRCRSCATKARVRRRQGIRQPQLLVAPLCFLSAVSALALSLAFCDAESAQRRSARAWSADRVHSAQRYTTASRGPPWAHAVADAGYHFAEIRRHRRVEDNLVLLSDKQTSISVSSMKAARETQEQRRRMARDDSRAEGSRGEIRMGEYGKTVTAAFVAPTQRTLRRFSNSFRGNGEDRPPQTATSRPATRHNHDLAPSLVEHETGKGVNCLRRLGKHGSDCGRQSGAHFKSSVSDDSGVRFSRPALRMSLGDEVDRADFAPEWPGTAAPPVLVTIGPQCAGKTSLLRALAARARGKAEGEGSTSSDGGRSGGGRPLESYVTDVSIDDHPQVYHGVPTDLFLRGCTADSEQDEMISGRRLSERFEDSGCRETRLVALRLLGRISAEDFASGVAGCDGKASPEAVRALCTALESAVSEKLTVSTPTVDVFIRESLFEGAILASKSRLDSAARTCPGFVAWGNTNTQARDFSVALQHAERTGRSVRFLRWGHELPTLTMDELSRRNVYRFATTGRYVETAAIETALVRVNKLYASTSGGDPAQLALAAGFHMDASGRVQSRSSPPRDNNQNRRAPPRSSRGGRSIGQGGRPDDGVDTRGRESTGRLPFGGDTIANGVDSIGGGFDGDVSGVIARNGVGVAVREKYTAIDSGSGGETTLGAIRSQRSIPLSTPPPLLGEGTTIRLDSKHSSLFASPPISRPPPVARPLPVSRLVDGADQRSSSSPVFAAKAHLGLGQEWTPRGGTRLATGGFSNNFADQGAWFRGSGTRRGGDGGAPSTVMFGSEWGRKRSYRRTGYSDEDVDPLMTSCRFTKPANSTGELRRNDVHEGVGADFEEMELVRRIKSFRERR